MTGRERDFTMGILERVVVIALGVLAIIFTMLLALILLVACMAKEGFLRLFPSFCEKHSRLD